MRTAVLQDPVKLPSSGICMDRTHVQRMLLTGEASRMQPCSHPAALHAFACTACLAAWRVGMQPHRVAGLRSSRPSGYAAAHSK